MKKLTLFSALLLLAACGSDDSQPVNSTTGNLIGKWKINIVTYAGATVTWSPCTYQNTFNFREDGKCLTEDYLQSTQNNECELADSYEKSYTRTGNNLVITYDNGEYGIETDSATIQEITTNKLVLSTFMYNDSDEPQPYIVTYSKVN